MKVNSNETVVMYQRIGRRNERSIYIPLRVRGLVGKGGGGGGP